jgi:hypothetical protein
LSIFARKYGRDSTGTGTAKTKAIKATISTIDSFYVQNVAMVFYLAKTTFFDPKHFESS